MKPYIASETFSTSKLPAASLPLRAIVEIIDGELRILPIAESDADAKLILDALRFAREDF